MKTTKFVKKDIIEVVVIAIVLVFAFLNIKVLWKFLSFFIHLMMPFIIGIALAFIINILINFIEKKFLNKAKIKNKRTISLLLSLAIIFTFIIILLLLIIPQLKNTVNIFVDNMPIYEENIQMLLNKINVDISIVESIENTLRNLGSDAIDFVKNNSSQIVEITLGVATNIINIIVNFVIALVFAIYLLVQKEKLLSQISKVLKAYLPKNKVNKINDIAKLSNKICAHFVSGQCFEAIIIGVLCFIGMLILAIPYSATISVLIGVTALIPIYGAFIGTILGAFLIFMVSPVKALIFIIFILILQQLEGNFIYPRVVGKSVGLPGIWVFVAVTIGGSLAGVLGMVLSVPVVSILYSILATNVNYKLKINSANKD